ncbi:apolipoprotein N-acyltransferase [bacterium]|nr:apolipoprotein N-acyltransferase [bacterium]
MNEYKKNLPPYLTIILSALALGLSRYPGTMGIFVFIALIPLFRFFDSGKKNSLQLFRAGALFSLVNILVAYHWIGLVTVPGVIGIIILFSLYYWGVFAYINQIWHKKEWLKWLGFISIWLSFEFFLFYTEFRFPWSNVGYALSNFNIFVQIADLGGIHLISFAVILANIFLYRLLSGARTALYLLLILFSVWLGYGYIRFNSIELELQDIKIMMMQPSIPTNKFDIPTQDILDIYTERTRLASYNNLDLFIWPEAAVTDFPLRNHSTSNKIKAIAEEFKLNIFFGTTDAVQAPVEHPEDFYFYNTATLLRYPELTYEKPYYKMYLVPVGERMPYLNLFPFLWKLEFGQANWEFGKELKYYTLQNKAGKEYTFSPQICYEILFPDISNQMVREGADFIVNLTNDAWFYRSIGTYQHAMMTRIRAIETRTPIIRSANTGHSVVISPNGRIETYSKLYDVANFQAPVFTTKSKSLFVYYLYWFPYIFPICAFFIFLLAKFKYKK